MSYPAAPREASGEGLPNASPPNPVAARRECGSWFFILVSSLMLFSDFARLDTVIDLANDRSLAKG
jgi:hypothetical protein